MFALASSPAPETSQDLEILLMTGQISLDEYKDLCNARSVGPAVKSKLLPAIQRLFAIR